MSENFDRKLKLRKVQKCREKGHNLLLKKLMLTRPYSHDGAFLQ